MTTSLPQACQCFRLQNEIDYAPNLFQLYCVHLDLKLFPYFKIFDHVSMLRFGLQVGG